MAVRKYKPTSNGRRNMSVLIFDEITTTTPEKSLLAVKNSKGGRNNTGKITVRHQGGGVRQKYRIIDFKRNKDGIPATVKSIEYDPNRSANIALLVYADGEKRYILAPKGLTVGTKLMSGESNYVIVRLGSGEVRKVLGTCKATIGVVGNESHELVRIGKAGRARHMGLRPEVRGSVMSPNDHPHGGGEGKCPVGRPSPMTPWGKPALGLKTRKHKKASNKLIVRRRNDK